MTISFQVVCPFSKAFVLLSCHTMDVAFTPHPIVALCFSRFLDRLEDNLLESPVFWKALSDEAFFLVEQALSPVDPWF